MRPAFICICQKCKMYLSKLAAQKSSLESVCLCYRSWRRRTREPCVLPSQQLLRRCDTTHTFTNLFFICLNFKMYLSKWQNIFVMKIIDKSNSCVVVTSLQLGFDPHSSSPLSSSSQSVCLSSATKKSAGKIEEEKNIVDNCECTCIGQTYVVLKSTFMNLSISNV